ncbi:hypothetical protein ACD661_07720 [Legionella lytica]|uniref:Coiled-coil protein n=1 Tax=Legionella lytica TaxID=96232 RepID=A0ABW8D9B3_9GAMM
MGAEQEHNAVISVEQANDLLMQMQTPILYEVKKPTVSVPLLQRIPFVSQFVKNASELGDKAIHVGGTFTKIPGLKTPEHLGQGLHWGGAALAALDFLLIPMIYLSSYIYGEKVPFTLNNNARWLYSGALLALTLTSILVPAAATPIGLVLGGISIGLSSFLLGKAIYERYHLGKERKALATEIVHAEEEMALIQEQAKVLQGALTRATTKEEQQALCAQVELVQKQYGEQKEKITGLKEREAVVNEKIKKLQFIHILDKGLGVGFASLAMVGVVLSIFLPAVGLPMLAGVGVASAAYLSARILGPLIRDAGSWLLDKLRNVFGRNEAEKTTANGLENVLEHSNTHTEQTSSRMQEHEGFAQSETAHAELNSTGAMLEHLLGTREAVIASLNHEHTATNELDEDIVINEALIDLDAHAGESQGENEQEGDSNGDSDSEDDGSANSDEEENRFASF